MMTIARQAAMRFTAGDAAVKLAVLSGWREDVRCVHEAGHATMGFLVGTPPYLIRVSDSECFVAFDKASVDAPAISDDDWLATVRKAEPMLDLSEVRAETERILQANWLLLKTITRVLEQRLQRDGEVSVTESEISWVWIFHRIRNGEL